MVFHHQPENKGWVWEVLPEELSSQLLKLCDLFLILFLLVEKSSNPTPDTVDISSGYLT